MFFWAHIWKKSYRGLKFAIMANMGCLLRNILRSKKTQKQKINAFQLNWALNWILPSVFWDKYEEKNDFFFRSFYQPFNQIFFLNWP